jgi:hypothetical protein
MFVKSTQKKKKKLIICHRRIQHIDYDFIIEDCTIFFFFFFPCLSTLCFPSNDPNEHDNPMIQMNMIRIQIIVNPNLLLVIGSTIYVIKFIIYCR